jgi:fatty-acyl-CoA synthase
MIDLFATVERHAAFDPAKPAVRFEGGVLSYAAFVDRVRAVAGAFLAAGVGEGDRIAVLAENHPDTLAAFYAAARLGAILAPLNWRLAPDELAFAVGHAEPRVLLHTARYAAAAEALAWPGLTLLAMAGAAGSGADIRATPRDKAPVLLVYTSGTTGRPKGALLSQRAIAGNAAQSHHMHQMTVADHVLTVLPLFHVGGLNIQTTPALAAGATVTLLPRFEPRATLATIAADRPTLTVLVPTTLQALLSEPDFAATDLSSLRAIATGSTVVPEALMAAFEKRGVPMLSVYGATETGPIAAYDRAGTARVRGGTGRAGTLSDVLIVGEDRRPLPAGAHGEIAVAGPVFSGYFRDEPATAAAFAGRHFLTGDIGSLAPDGTLTVHDRKTNMIISGGENVYPAEVERVLAEHPAVAAAAVVGRPDPFWQEVPVAFVVVRGEVAEEALVRHLRERLAAYKVPRDIRYVADLPRTALGKVRHEVLRTVAAGPAAT